MSLTQLDWAIEYRETNVVRWENMSWDGRTCHGLCSWTIFFPGLRTSAWLHARLVLATIAIEMFREILSRKNRSLTPSLCVGCRWCAHLFVGQVPEFHPLFESLTRKPRPEWLSRFRCEAGQRYKPMVSQGCSAKPHNLPYTTGMISTSARELAAGHWKRRGRAGCTEDSAHGIHLAFWRHPYATPLLARAFVQSFHSTIQPTQPQPTSCTHRFPSDQTGNVPPPSAAVSCRPFTFLWQRIGHVDPGLWQPPPESRP